MTDTLLSSLHKVLDKPATPLPTPQTTIFNRDPYGYDYDYGGYYDYNRNYQRSRGYSVTSVKTTRYVAVVDDAGTEKKYVVPYDCEGWFDIAQHVWPTAGDVMRVPMAHCKFSYGEPVFNACVYNATNDYMQARWGRKLDDSDRRWLAAHPLSTDSGVPQEYTATCVDQLVSPYGLRVSRVRLRKGSLVIGDSLMAWIHALGCNPFALADRSTSNAEAAERMGMPLDQANQLWRVEFTDEPLPCSIIGERGWSNTTTVKTGNYGGHARYLAPRAHAGDWFISVQLDTDTQVAHLVPPPNPEYTPRRGAESLLLSTITGPDGQLIAEKINLVWTAVGSTVVPVTTPETEETPLLADAPDEFLRDDQEMRCMMCSHVPLRAADFLDDVELCVDCLDEAWQNYQCPHCHADFGVRGAPHFLSATDTEASWQCQDCKGELTHTYGGNNPDQVLDDLCYVMASGSSMSVHERPLDENDADRYEYWNFVD